jgi:CRISPR/Cas system CSM-associated protein Csm3 (group 7 of RAMP superfamily)
MSDPTSAHEPSRRIVERVVITGQLRLLTPASLGNGDSDGLLDMPLSRDAAEGGPLLTGTSIAGALRNYLRLRKQGYRPKEDGDKASHDPTERLFGGRRSSDEGEQSPLIVDDARAVPHAIVSEIRDNVRIEPQTRTAQDGKKFDLELLPAGTTFDLRFELLIAKDDERKELLQALALALTGFEQKEISLGMRKRRGFGRCVVEGWQVQTYNLVDREGLLAWLAADLGDEEGKWNLQPTSTGAGPAAAALGVAQPDTDARQRFIIKARFELASPLLIRSEEPIIPDNSGREREYPDTTHLRSRRNGNGQSPVLPGTSLAGALRARARRILNTLTEMQQETTMVQKMLDSVFGSDMDLRPKQKYASRLVVHESTIEARNEDWLVQQRVGIDRFTGGAYDTALFSEAPLTSGEVELEMVLQGRPAGEGVTWDYQAEVGVLLLLLKDLWTGDLPLGGTSSIGRGRLRGISATLQDNHNGPSRSWQLEGTPVSESDREALEAYVGALHDVLQTTPEEEVARQ